MPERTGSFKKPGALIESPNSRAHIPAKGTQKKDPQFLESTVLMSCCRERTARSGVLSFSA